MASPQEDALVSIQQPSPQETSRPRALPPRRRGTAGSDDGGGEPVDVGVRCAALCFRLPSRSKSKKTPPPVKLVPCRSKEEDDASAASQRVTFLASASLSTWWPSSPSAAGAGDFVVQRRASGGATSSSARSGGGGGRRTLSSSFSYWRRSLSSSRVTPHGAAPARVSFSFPSSPVSVSSCMSTPKIAHGGCHE